MTGLTKKIENYLDELFPDARCELNYTKDYELLLATMLSAQTTDKRVNSVTYILFKKYPTLKDLSEANIIDVQNIIRPIGTYHKKAQNLIEIAKRLEEDYHGQLPNNREYLESLPGVGRKTTNVVLSNIFNVPCIAVDTHVARVSKRLGLTKSDDVSIIEQDLMKFFPKDKWSRVHHQLVLFGRYTCKSKNPDCKNCPFIQECKYKSKNL